MTMERNADELLPAANEGRADGERGGRRRTFALTVLILVLILWNLFLVAVTFAGMPRNDFGRPLLGTRAFLDGKDMYGETDAVITWCNSDTILRLWNLNPPHSHLLYLPLAVLPAELALSIWYVVGGLCLYGSIRILLSETGIELTPRRRDWMTAGLLAFSATGVALVTVHMTFLLMLVTTLAWRDARHRRWGKAGAWLGLALSIKPFFLIFIPYLVLKRCWRGLSAMGLTTGLSFLLGLLVFGLESHQSWLRVLSRADTWAWLPLNASLYGAMSRVLMKNTLFTTMATWEPGLVRAAWLALGIPAGLVALLRILPDRSTRGADRAFAILLVRRAAPVSPGMDLLFLAARGAGRGDGPRLVDRPLEGGRRRRQADPLAELVPVPRLHGGHVRTGILYRDFPALGPGDPADREPPFLEPAAHVAGARP